MNSLTKTTMIRAVCVAFFFVSTLSATASAESVECKDDADFRWKNKNKKSCDWIGSRNDSKKKRLCAKNKIKEKCLVACDECTPTVTPPIYATCPVTKPEEGATCQKLAKDERCLYDYAFKGCSTGNLSCIPSTEFKCEGTWVQEFLPQILCVADDPNYNLPCDPDAPEPIYGTCPATKPKEGSTCKKLAEEERCLYDYAFKGCSAGNLECTPGTEFKCEKGTWVEESLPQILCIIEPDDPNYDLPCNPDAPEPIYGTCPATKPEEGSKCKTLAKGEECLYDYLWLGCGDVATLTCEASMQYTCTGGLWSGFPTSIASIKCGVTDPRGVGKYREACDPNDPNASPIDLARACPDELPEPDDPCESPGNYPEAGCKYNYIVLGCSENELFCGSTAFAQCVKRSSVDEEPAPVYYDSDITVVPIRVPSQYMWIVAMAGMQLCEDAPEPAGDSCDPDTFNQSVIVD